MIPRIKDLIAEHTHEKKLDLLSKQPGNLSYEDALTCFAFERTDDFTLDDLGIDFAAWTRENREAAITLHTVMEEAYQVLSTEKIPVLWGRIPQTTMTLQSALAALNIHKDPVADLEDEPCVRDRFKLNSFFGTRTAFFCTDLNQAVQLDQAYRFLWDYPLGPYSSKTGFPQPKMKAPFSPLFKQLSESEIAAGWTSLNKSISNDEAKVVLDLGQVADMLPCDFTNLFRDHQERCKTVEEAEKLDLAYQYFYWHSTLSCHYFSGPIEPPYAPVLAKQLGEPLTAFVAEEAPAAPASAITLMPYEDALTCFGYESGEKFTFEELELRLREWERERGIIKNKDRKPEESDFPTVMTKAHNILVSDLIKTAWAEAEAALTPMTVPEAAGVFGIYSGLDNLGRGYINALLRDTKDLHCKTLARAQELDSAYRTLFKYAKVRSWEEEQGMGLEYPISPVFKAVMEYQKKAGWDFNSPHSKGQNPDSAQEILGIENWLQVKASDITKHFRDRQVSCSDVEQAEKLDAAYRCLFIERVLLSRDGDTPIDQPFAQSFGSQQAAPAPVPVMTKPQQEEVAEEAPALTPDMSVDEAISVFVFENKEALELGELTRQYKKLAIRDGLSPEMLQEIDVAYQVLKTYLEAPKEAAYQQERKKLGFGSTDTITKKDLELRYKKASQITDSKAEQRELDEAYQVLLKIAA